MSEWPAKPLGDVVEISKERIEPNEHPKRWFNYIGLEHIESHNGALLNTEPTAGAKIRSTKHVFHHGEVLFGKLRPNLNKVYLATTDGICSTDIYVLRSRQGTVTAGWLAYFLRSPQTLEYVTRAMAGANLPRISQQSLMSLSILVPPLAEQQRMVKLLDEADAIRKLRAKADQRTADLIPALFHEMFGDPVTNPMGWPVRSLSDLVDDLQGGKNVKPAGESENGGNNRVLKVSAVTSGNYRPSESKPLPTSYRPPASHVVRPGDLLFSRANTTELVGATCYVENTPPNLLLPDKLWRFVWSDIVQSQPLFMLYLLQNKSLRRELSKLASGTGGSMKNISKAKLLSLVVPVPSISQQRLFSTRVSEIRAVIEDQTAIRNRNDYCRRILQRRAFAGTL